MIGGSIPSASILGTWSENCELRSVEDDTLFDLTGITEITLKLRDLTTRFDEMQLTMTNGDITIPSTGVIQWRAEVSAMGTLVPKLYEVFLILEDDTDTVPVFVGLISITE